MQTNIIKIIEELFTMSKNDRVELSKLIDKFLIPSISENKKLAEISTPYELRQKMLNEIPEDFWKNPKKVFEPCCGKGGFLIDIIDRFMEGMCDFCKDPKERYRIIVEDCLFFSDINDTNVSISKLLIDQNNIYKLNFNFGDTLQLNVKDKWDILEFDAVIGNPPYQLKIGPKKTKPIWNLFFKMAVNLIVKDGYLVFVNPSGWRSPDGIFRDIFNIIKEKQLIYLSMNDFKEGSRLFKSGTNFDYYVLKNSNEDCNTVVEDIDGKISIINLKNLDFIPGGEFNTFQKLMSNTVEKTDVLYSRSYYETRKLYMSQTTDITHKYPCVYTITKKNGMNLLYSDRDIGHFGVPKIIWSNGSGTYPIIDYKGEYGLTQFSYAIIDTPENLLEIEKALNSEKFIKLMTYVKFTANKYNYKVIKLFVKDFWKEFI